MTCVWDSIINSLNEDDKKKIFPNGKSINACGLVEFFQENNIETKNVVVNGEKITKKQIEENIERIKCINKNCLGNGYDCSTFDPILILLCELLKIDIEHKYLNNIIKYSYIINSQMEQEKEQKEKDIVYKNNNLQKRLFKFTSNSGHFQRG